MAYIGKTPADVLIDPHVESSSITDLTIATADIANDAITNAKIADSQIDSEHYVDGSIDNEHLAGSIAMNKTAFVAGTGLTLSTNTLNVDAAQTQITSVGTIGTGVWNGTAIASAYLDADTAHLSGTQTFSGEKTFSADVTLSGAKLLVAASAQGIFGAADGDTGIRWEGSNVLAIDTNGSERLTVLADGQVKIAGSVANQQLYVEQDNTSNEAVRIIGPAATSATVAVLNVMTNNGASADTGLKVMQNGAVGIGTASPSNQFVIKSGSNADMEFGSESSSCFIQLYNRTTSAWADLRVITGGGERIRVTSNGLTFNGDTAAANALDDYEEGTWTPSFIVPTNSVGYSYQTGSYTKVGSLVTAIFAIGLNSISSPSGSSGISGFPFPAAPGENYVTGMTVGLARAFTTSFADHPIRGYLVNNDSWSTLHTGDSSQGHVYLDANTLTASTQFYGSITYNTDA
jgi:hypothetical protein